MDRWVAGKGIDGCMPCTWGCGSSSETRFEVGLGLIEGCAYVFTSICVAVTATEVADKPSGEGPQVPSVMDHDKTRARARATAKFFDAVIACLHSQLPTHPPALIPVRPPTVSPPRLHAPSLSYLMIHRPSHHEHRNGAKL